MTKLSHIYVKGFFAPEIDDDIRFKSSINALTKRKPSQSDEEANIS